MILLSLLGPFSPLSLTSQICWKLSQIYVSIIDEIYKRGEFVSYCPLDLRARKAFRASKEYNFQGFCQFLSMSSNGRLGSTEPQGPPVCLQQQVGVVTPVATSGEASGQRITIMEKIMYEDPQDICQGKFRIRLRELDAMK